MSLYALLTNNSIVNTILIWLKLDAKKELPAGHWKAFVYNPDKSIQQNAGFSHTPEVEEALAIVKAKLKLTLSTYLKQNDTVIDFGCGPGIYIEMLKNQYQVIGVDVSEQMINTANKKLPTNKFYLGNFITLHFPEKAQALYSISVLEYVPVSQLDVFFKKCADVLTANGIIFIQYPHALSKRDLYYPDRNYICYSPQKVSEVASTYFEVMENKQSYDGRETCVVDLKPYPTASKTFKNGYLLIAKKK